MRESAIQSLASEESAWRRSGSGVGSSCLGFGMGLVLVLVLVLGVRVRATVGVGVKERLAQVELEPQLHHKGEHEQQPEVQQVHCRVGGRLPRGDDVLRFLGTLPKGSLGRDPRAPAPRVRAFFFLVLFFFTTLGLDMYERFTDVYGQCFGPFSIAQTCFFHYFRHIFEELGCFWRQNRVPRGFSL